MQKVEL